MKISAIVAALAVCCCVSAHEIPQGVYMSMADIMNGTPTIKTAAFVIRKSNNPQEYSDDEYEMKPVERQYTKLFRKRALAYSDGKDLYINCRQYKAHKKYARVLSNGRYLVFYAGSSPITKSYNAKKGGIIAGSIVLGIVTAVLTGGAAYFYVIPTDNRQFCYALDTYDNQLHLFTIDFIAELLKDKGEAYDMFMVEKGAVDEMLARDRDNGAVAAQRLIERYIPIVDEFYPN